MTRPQNKRMQHFVYDYLLLNGPQSAKTIMTWYNHDREQRSNHSKGAQHGTSIHILSGVLSHSLLFEIVERAPIEDSHGYITWGARPLDEVVVRAIASKRPIKKYPMFLRHAMKEKMEGSEIVLYRKKWRANR